jgi:predicted amino acid dehydrogenase
MTEPDERETEPTNAEIAEGIRACAEDDIRVYVARFLAGKITSAQMVKRCAEELESAGVDWREADRGWDSK